MTCNGKCVVWLQDAWQTDSRALLLRLPIKLLMVVTDCPRHPLTVANGTGNASRTMMTDAKDMEICFAHPHSYWQRGKRTGQRDDPSLLFERRGLP